MRLSETLWPHGAEIFLTLEFQSEDMVRLFGTLDPTHFPKSEPCLFNWINMWNWSTFRDKFVCTLLNRLGHPCLTFGTIHKASGESCRLLRTTLVIGTREYLSLIWNWLPFLIKVEGLPPWAFSCSQSVFRCSWKLMLKARSTLEKTFQGRYGGFCCHQCFLEPCGLDFHCVKERLSWQGKLVRKLPSFYGVF